jgi:DNA-binding NtrC family response regulator
MDFNGIKKVFIVDDDPFISNIIAKKLELLGITSIENFTTGNDCVENIYKNPHCIFLDYNMPGLSGLETLKKIKSQDPDIHVVILSGQDEMTVAIDSLKFGAFDYIIKDDHTLLKIEEVIQTINKLEKLLYDKITNKRKKERKMALFFTALIIVLILLSKFLFF